MGLSPNFIRKGFQFLPDDCVAAVTVAVAAYRRRKQRIKNTNQLALVLGLLDEEDAVVSRENICMLAFEACVVQQLRPRYRLLDDVAELFAW